MRFLDPASTALAKERGALNTEAPAPALLNDPETTRQVPHFGHYEVLLKPDGRPWELGRGSMGVTYKAFDTRLKIEVVLKQIKPGMLEDKLSQKLFLREARAAARVRHPNIAAVIHLSDSAPFFYTMEFVAGEPLSAVLGERGRLPVDEALNYADQMAAALGAMAKERIAHRDLKPSNLMLLADDEALFGVRIKVIDFGLAKGFSEGGFEAQTHLAGGLSQSGIFSGTPFYASPEQCATQPDIDTRSDLYSVGVILWQMLTGLLPFSGTLGQVLAMHQFQAPPWDKVAALPADVVEILRRLLEKNPGDRFQTPRELRETIAASSHGSERIAAPASPSRWEAPTPPLVDAREAGIATDLPLGIRYHLVESFPEGDAGRLYRAIDHDAGGAIVAIKLLSPRCAVDDDFLEYLREDIARITAAAQPMFLASPMEFEESDAGKFVVREWAEGLSLLEILRARRALTTSDVQRLLAALPDTLEAVAGLQLGFTEALLHKLFITSNAGTWRRAEFPSLRTKPVSEWPAFRLRWNPLNFRAPSAGALDEVTRPNEDAEPFTDDPVVVLARLVYELLGGHPGRVTTLTTCSDQANAILRRALEPGGGRLSFPTAGDFWRALFQDQSAAQPPPPTTSIASVRPPPRRDASTAPNRRLSAPDGKLAAKLEPKKRRSILAPTAWLLFLAAGFLGLRAWWKFQQENPDGTDFAPRTVVAPASSTGSGPPNAQPAPTTVRVASAPAPAPAADNRSAMQLVPIPGTRVLFSTRQVRRGEFAAFLRETHYTPRGVGADATWQKVILEQPDAQPVVNVTIGEARAFCFWLTQRERTAGRLTAEQTYRLPTNHEWNLAAGVDASGNRASPNRYGILDLNGLVSDWCESPRGAGMRIIRGGAQPGILTDKQPDLRSASIGFRVVLDEGARRP